MDIQDKKQKECGNEDPLNKGIKLFSSSPEDEENRSWQTTLPHDILSIISDLLPLSDFINFRGVCRHWRSAPSCRFNITELSKKEPWCILYDCNTRDKDICHFYQCSDRRSCSVKLPGLRGAKCFVSKHGWLFIRRDKDHLFFNPLTLEEIFLPKYPAKPSACQVGIFSASPSSPQDCVVVLVSSTNSSTVVVASCRLTDDKWAENTITVDIRGRGLTRDSVLLPSPRYAYFKANSNHDRLVNLVHHIFICYDNHFLMLDFLEWTYAIGSLLSLFATVNGYDEYMKYKWYSKLKEVHCDDWICKFGKEFTFSFCLFNDFKRFDDNHMFGDSIDKDVFGENSPTISSVPVIKAAWLYNDWLNLI